MNPETATAIMRLGAAAASGDDDRLREALAGVAPRVSPADIEEYLLQTYLFAGYPRTINAFFVWQAWAVGNGSRTRPSGPEVADAEGWRRRGERLCRLVYGENYEALQRRLDRLHPALAEWTLVEGYGKVLSREGPDPAGRELAAVGALVVMAADRQLIAHLRGALNAGVRRAVLEAALRQVVDEYGGDDRGIVMLDRI